MFYRLFRIKDKRQIKNCIWFTILICLFDFACVFGVEQRQILVRNGRERLRFDTHSVVEHDVSVAVFTVSYRAFGRY